MCSYNSISSRYRTKSSNRQVAEHLRYRRWIDISNIKHAIYMSVSIYIRSAGLATNFEQIFILNFYPE